MSQSVIKIAIAEPSPIVRMGLELQLKRLPRHKVQIIQLVDDSRRDWEETLEMTAANVYILNPLLAGLKPQQYARAVDKAKFIALSYGTTVDTLLKSYDGVLSITASVRQIAELFDRLIQEEEPTGEAGEQQSLTPREREIVICVVKGMTNKEIAQALYLSTHTVITHRRNISKKLQIHSPSGLTIYAIMHKMVEMEEINYKL